MFMEKNTCCVLDYSFRGYNTLNCKKKKELRSIFKQNMQELLKEEEGMKFISGMNIGFEMIAAEIALELKNSYNNITFECALPDEMQAVEWKENERNNYYNILQKCDIEKFISKRKNKDNIHKRNKYMISSSKYIIIFCDKKEGYINKKYHGLNKKVILIPIE